MIEYLKLENVADERGEEPAKVARTLLRLGCDLYLHFGPSRKSRSGVSFYPEHPTVQMEHNIGPGDHPLTKNSQEVVIKRLGRRDTSTVGLMVLIYLRHEVGQNEERSNGEIIVHDPKLEVLEYQIELMEQDDTVCVVFDSDDLILLPPLPAHQDGVVSGSPTTHEKNYFENFEGKNSSKRKGEKEDHTLIIWEAMQSLDNDLKKEAKPTMIWNYLRKNINKYNTNGVIISISHDVMKYFKSNATEGHLTKESFRKSIKRLRENPPK